MISAWGEAHLVVMGLVCILVAIVADAVRLTLLLKLLQQVSGWHTDLVVAPCAAWCLDHAHILLAMKQQLYACTQSLGVCGL